eukprot:Selendium_serpulae@DN6449_c1_g1_i14.p1
MKPDVVLFGDSLPPKAVKRAAEAAQKCDLLLVVGTSANVSPASEIPRQVKLNGRGATVVEVNLERTPLTHRVSDFFVQGRSSDLVRTVAALEKLAGQSKADPPSMFGASGGGGGATEGAMFMGGTVDAGTGSVDRSTSGMARGRVDLWRGNGAPLGGAFHTAGTPGSGTGSGTGSAVEPHGDLAVSSAAAPIAAPPSSLSLGGSGTQHSEASAPNSLPSADGAAVTRHVGRASRRSDESE